MRSCGNCKHRAWASMFGTELCMGYEMAADAKEERETAKDCPNYEEGTPSCFEYDDYTPSATFRDYSPLSPWDAPGMSVKDFI